MLEVQAGRFKVKTDADATLSDVMKERKFVEGINEEDKLVHLQEWLPAMSEEVWIRVKNAQYGGKNDDRIIHKCWELMSCESAKNSCLTRSRTLYGQLLTQKRTDMPEPPMLVIEPNFLINFSNNGIYKYASIIKDINAGNGGERYTNIIMKPLEKQAALPSTTICVKGDCCIQMNHDWKLAYITNKTKDFHKNCMELFIGNELEQADLKCIVKKPTWKAAIEAKNKEIQEYDNKMKSADQTVTDSSPPIQLRRRCIKKTLSDVSVPEELKAKAAKIDV